MQKIWDSQNQKPMYAFDEAALYQNIKNRRAAIDKKTNFIETTYIGISIVCSLILLSIGSGRIYAYLSILALIGIGIFIFFHRKKRLGKNKAYANDILGELNEALANLYYLERAFKNFASWYILPLAIPALLNMATAPDGPPLWKWIYVIGSFLLGYFVVRWSLHKSLAPKINQLEALKAKLLDA